MTWKVLNLVRLPLLDQVVDARLAEDVPARPCNARFIQELVADRAYVLIRREPRIDYAGRVNA